MAQKITRRSALKVGAAAAAAGAATIIARPVKARTKKLKFRMQTHWPPGLGYYKPIYEGLTTRIKEASGGEIEIQPMPANTFVPTRDVLEAVGRGIIDCAFIYPAYWIGKMPAAGHLNGQLFMFNDFTEMWFFFNQMGALDIIRQAYAEFGVHLVGPVASGGLSLWSKKPIIKPEDLNGFKVRSTGIAASVFKKMGSTPVFFPASELYQALQTGVCDGAHWGGITAAWEMKFQEVTKYIIMPYLTSVQNHEVFFSKKAWQKLSSDQKKLVENCVLAHSADTNAYFSYKDFRLMDEYQKKGLGKIVTLDPESVARMRAHSLEVIDEYSKKDPEYCGRIGALMHDFLKMTNKI